MSYYDRSLPPEMGHTPPAFPSGGQGNLSNRPNLRPVPDFPGAPRDHVNINGERVPMTDIDMSLAPQTANPAILPTGLNPPINRGRSEVNDFVGKLGLGMAQASLLVGGFVAAFVLPEFMRGIHPKLRDMTFIAGLASMAAGGIWTASNWLKVQSPIVAKSAFITPGMLQNTQVHTQKYANPVNNLSHIKPENRFDLQTNYVMNKPDDSFDSRINDMILKEAKSLGFGTAGNYPVKMQPYQVKTLIPTTQIEPSRDFNTVKMIA